jgi:hypothetical protein
MWQNGGLTLWCVIHCRNEAASALKKFLASFERIFEQEEPKVGEHLCVNGFMALVVIGFGRVGMLGSVLR